MSGSLLAIAVAVLGLALTVLWFGVYQRRTAETRLGVQTLANMKWRESVNVVLETLQRDGYQLPVSSTARGSNDTEFLLVHGEEKVLLGYKHGTAYHLSEANVREFVNALRLRGARRGILLTLGSITGQAHHVAKAHDVQLLDGESIWPKVRQLIHPHMLKQVKSEASAQARPGLLAGATCSLLVGAAIYALGRPEPNSAVPVQVAKMDAKPAQAPPPATVSSDAAMLEQLHATARAMAEVAKLSSTELARRRVGAAKQVSLIPQVDAAAWSAPRTLLVTLNDTDGKDKQLAGEVCRILIQYEELRFTRVQLQPPSQSGLPVRWRLCE